MVAEIDAVIKHRKFFLAKGREFGQYPDSLNSGQIDAALNADKTSFVAQLPYDIDKEKFLMNLGETNLSTDSLVLGGGYEDQMASAVLYPSVLAPYPATFDSVAIAGIIDMIGSSNQSALFEPENNLHLTNQIVDRTGYLTNRMFQLGVIEYSHDDRFLITPEKSWKLRNILDQFDNEE